MALPATDAFTRADGALGANWTGSVGSDLAISSNEVTGASGADSSMYWNADTPGNDQYAKCTIKNMSAGQYVGPFVRGNATDFVILVAQSNTDFQIQWYNGAAWTQIGSTYSATPTAGDVLEIRATGTTFKGFINGVERISGTNVSAPASGSGGLYVYNNSARIDDFEVGNVATATLEQEGFAFGDDDNNEASHTLNTQDTNISTADATTKLIRLLANATGDPAAIAYKLKYQKNGSGGYATAPIGATVTTSPPTAPTATVTTVGTAAATWAINRSTGSSGDLIVFVVAWDDSTNVTSVSLPTGVNSETAVSIVSPIASASTEMRMQAWYYIATGTWGAGTLTFTPSASETCRAVSFTIPAANFNASDPIGWANTAASAGTAETNVNSPTGTAEADDGDGRIYIAFGSDADALTVPGSNWNTINNSTGGGVGLAVGSRNTLASNSESVTALTATIASDSWASIAFVVKPKITTNDLYISTSGNITAGGEDTTARLTAPSGKTTSDFVTGRRWDNENGTDTIDITTDNYTEVEWCLTLKSGLTGGDYFDFRVYNADAVLDTYTVTPRWTIISSITGIGLATQASDVPTSTATLKLAAVVSQTQANNTTTATGTLAIKGILTQTQASDSIVATGTGTTTTTGTGLITQADNTIASTAALKIQAVANQTQANNVIVSSGTLSLAANVTQSQADNTATSTAALSIKATATQAQADNTVTATAALGIKASTNQTQADNVPSATSTLSIVANVNQTQADNVSTATGALYIYANTTATQDSNTITVTGAGTPSTNGVVAVTQDSNTINANASLDLVANGLVTQADNAPSITATLKLFGAVGVTADDNTATIAGALDIQGAVNVSQGDNVIVAYNVTPVPDRDVTPNLAYYKAVRAEQKRDLAMYMDRYYG